jgi:hypothetical protein
MQNYLHKFQIIRDMTTFDKWQETCKDIRVIKGWHWEDT